MAYQKFGVLDKYFANEVWDLSFAKNSVFIHINVIIS